jgi:hypothetical protein
MEAMYSSEKSVDIPDYIAYIPENITLHGDRCENHESNKEVFFFPLILSSKRCSQVWIVGLHLELDAFREKPVTNERRTQFGFLPTDLTRNLFNMFSVVQNFDSEHQVITIIMNIISRKP